MSTRWGNDASTQRHYPKSVTLVQIGPGGAAVPALNYVYFRVPIVDARLRVKISLLWIMAPGSAFETDITGFANLWLAESDEDPDLMGSGRTFPLVNIEGTEAAPTAVPSAAPRLGYSREFESAADYIEGKFKILLNVTIGAWVLRTRYQPAPGQRFTPEEWQQITALAQPTLFNTPKLAF